MEHKGNEVGSVGMKDNVDVISCCTLILLKLASLAQTIALLQTINRSLSSSIAAMPDF